MKSFFQYLKLQRLPEQEALVAPAIVPAITPIIIPVLQTTVANEPESVVDSPERNVATNIGGIDYRIVSDDEYLNVIKGEFEPEMVKLFDSLIKPADTVFDVGANIGCTSILFGNRAKQVYSFEPSPTTCRYLEKNVHEAKLDNVRIVNAGVGKISGSYELAFSPDNRSGGFVSDQVDAADGLTVERIDIVKGDDFVAANAIEHVDFIKIDVEGFERNVIEGLSETISHSQPVVTLELNHWCLKASLNNHRF